MVKLKEIIKTSRKLEFNSCSEVWDKNQLYELCCQIDAGPSYKKF